jgi:hypothetical protein
VGFQITLVDYVQAVLVAQLEKPRLRRVMAGPDRVDVVLLHQQDVGQGHLVVHRPAAVGVEFVAVHPVKQHPVAVYGQDAVTDLDPAKANPEPDPLSRGIQDSVIEPG